MDVGPPPFDQGPPAPFPRTPLELRVRYERLSENAAYSQNPWEKYELTIPSGNEAPDTRLLAQQWASLGHEPTNIEIVACTPSGQTVPVKHLISPIRFPCAPTTNQYSQLFPEARRAQRHYAPAPSISSFRNGPGYPYPNAASQPPQAASSHVEQGHVAPANVRRDAIAPHPGDPVSTPHSASAPAPFPSFPYRPHHLEASNQEASRHVNVDQSGASARQPHFENRETFGYVVDLTGSASHKFHSDPRKASQRAAMNAMGRRSIQKDPVQAPSSQSLNRDEAAANGVAVASPLSEIEPDVGPLSLSSKHGLHRPPSTRNKADSYAGSPAAQPSPHVNEIRDSLEHSESLSPSRDGAELPTDSMDPMTAALANNPAFHDGYRMFPRDREHLTEEVNRVLDAIENNFSGSNAKNPRRPIRISIFNELNRLNIKGHFGPRGDLLGGSSLRNYTLGQLGITPKLWDYLDYKFGAGRTSREMMTKDGGKQSYRIQNRLTAAERRMLGQDGDDNDELNSVDGAWLRKSASRQPRGRKRRFTEVGQQASDGVDHGPRYSC